MKTSRFVYTLFTSVLVVAVAVPAVAQDAEATAPASSEPATADAPEAVETSGKISISSTPAGQVFLDGNSTGLTTPVVDLAVATGAHTLRVVDETSGAEKTVTFQMEAGAALNLDLNLAVAESAATDAATDAAATDAAATDAAATDAAATDAAATDAAATDAAATDTAATDTAATDTAATDTAATDAAATDAAAGDSAVETAPAPEQDWTWMTVAGTAGLTLGVMGLVSGAVILSNDLDPDQESLGFGLFGAGAGLLLGGGVLLYLDDELQDDSTAAAAEPTAGFMPLAPSLAAR